MKGYLMQETKIIAGEAIYVESFSGENNYGVVFEDDEDTAYFYAVEKDNNAEGITILDALHIYEVDEIWKGQSLLLRILWSADWLKCALVLDGMCHAIFDFENHGGYNINSFPPPNEIWTKGDRTLTNEIISSLF